MLLLVFAAPATWACDDWLAKTVAITGAVERKSTAADWQQLQVEQTVCPGDSVRVGPNSRAALYLRNNSFVRLDENSLLDFPAQQQEDGFLLGLSQGFAHFISRIVNRFEVSTPYVNAVVEGTEFIVSASPAAAGVAVMEGKVKTYNDAGTESITSGQQVQVTSRTASLTRINVPSASRVEWAIHYPPILTLQNIQPVSAVEKARLDALAPFLQQNRPDLALQSLEQNPVASPALDLARASLLLAVGRVDEFDALIPALLQGPQAGTARALKAVADAARNRAEPALASAHKAVELAPQQAASHIALSYAQQASLQLDDALASAKKATDVEPSNALAWLRLVELRLTQGDIGAAKKALAQIDKLPPEQQQPQVAILSAKGFVNLFSLKLKTARDNFQAALKQDSADPQNHLGLGLALLRDGKLEDGRRQLEYAVSLDPLRSTLRSYLGRAYFEEKREGEAIKQWDLAKQFDPNDPTPYFYTGVHKLFANDPIGAVDELEKSKELNDKRDIYRSETLLQSDAASRSATLARAYDEVGYDQGVLLNGWDAIRRDPTNSEGHRLLADKYAGDPRYETARVSELLQSQLWQPLSAYPLQPQTAEANMAIVAGAGPQRPSFNEYHSLFTQDGVYGMANGYGGSDGTWGDDLVGSFLAGPVAVSLGQYHYETNGWRENSDQEQDVYNGFVQWQMTPDTSVQYEHRAMSWDRGFLAPAVGFTFDTTASSATDRGTDRLGITHRYSPSGAFLLSFIKQDWEAGTSASQELGPVAFKENSDSLATELQWTTAWGLHRVDFGAAYVDIDSSEAFGQTFAADLGGFLYQLMIDRKTEGNPKLTTGYVDYLYKLNVAVDIGLGLGFYELKDDSHANEQQTEYFDGVELGSTLTSAQVGEDRTKWLPRFGVAYQPFPSTQLRLASFYSVAKPSVINQSIEPTSFFGFNKIYNDFDGAESMNYAVAVDSSVDGFHYGASFVDRKLQVPDDGILSSSLRDFNEKVAEIYGSLQPMDKVAVSVGALWSQKETQDEDAFLLSSITRIDLYQLPVRFAWYRSDGLSFFLDQSYFVQDVDTAVEADLNRSSSWITDASMQYRMARRLGAATVGVKNLFNEGDEYLGSTERELAFYPGRFWFVSININY